MVEIHCTLKLAKRLPFPLARIQLASTNILGSWSANVFNIGRSPYIIVSNERTLLTVVVPLKEIKTFWKRTLLSLEKLLLSIGLPEAQIKHEILEMGDVQFTWQTNRQTLGSMNDFVHLVKSRIEYSSKETMDDVNMSLSGVPCGPLNMDSPAKVVLRLFSE
jgi:hypothetical protein